MGNLAKLFSLGNLHPRENLRATGLLASLNSEIILECDGCNSFAIDLHDTFNLTIEVSGTVDGTNWTPIPVIPVNQALRLYVAAIAGTTQGVWEGKCSAFWKIRARCTAFTSGAAQVSLSASTAQLDDMSRLITPAIGTNTAAAGTGVTLTLASPGAGLRHYINYIQVNKFAAATLTAAATPIIITTTNLPGTLAFSVAADAAAQGTLSTPVDLMFDRPLAASAQTANTTIVAPATTGVIWRITAGYFVAP